MKCSWKGYKDRNRHKNRIKRGGQTRLVCVKDIHCNIPIVWRWARGDPIDNEKASTSRAKCLGPLACHLVTCVSHWLLPMSLTLHRWSWFFPPLRGLWEKVWRFIPTCASLFFSFFKVEISSRTPIPLFRSGSVHSGSASWDDCAHVFPDKLRVSTFPW